jgi:tetratricopeptide (TPR) repeat protein
MSSPSQKEIDNAFDNEDYKSAIRLLKYELKKDPDNHWLLTKLSSAYYESFNYNKAKLISEQALKIMPDCPLVIWDYAGPLFMLGENAAAAKAYKKIIKLSKGDIVIGECWETISWTKAIVNDSIFGLGCVAEITGKKGLAKKYFTEYYNNRLQKVSSIYPIDMVRKKLKKLDLDLEK